MRHQSPWDLPARTQAGIVVGHDPFYPHISRPKPSVGGGMEKVVAVSSPALRLLRRSNVLHLRGACTGSRSKLLANG